MATSFRSPSRALALFALLAAPLCAPSAQAPLCAPSAQTADLPKFDGLFTALENAPGASGPLDATNVTSTDPYERGRNTYSFAVLDASVGWDNALADLQAAYGSSFAGASKIAPIAVVEGNFALMEPPLSIPTSGSTRRIVRGSGGLRLGVVHDGDSEVETLALPPWPTETRTFLPHAGLLQMAESLSSESPAKYGFLANVLPASAREISVRTVRAFRGPNGRPWLVAGCSVQEHPASFVSGDQAYAAAARMSRLYEWVGGATPGWVDASKRMQDWGQGHSQWNTNTWGVGLGDLNGDGTTDIVFGNYGTKFWGASNHVLLGDSNGNFTFATSAIPFVGNDVTTDVVVEDLDADGFDDIVVINRYWGWGTNTSVPLGDRSRDYVLFGRLAAQPIGGGLSQPKFTAPVFLEPYDDAWSTDQKLESVRDGVAADVGDIDHDGDLDIVVGNHGNPGYPFVLDNDYPCVVPGNPAFQRNLNRDAVYRLDVVHNTPPLDPTRSFTRWDLPGSGGDGVLTTDIVFHDVARPLTAVWMGSAWDTTFPWNTWYGTKMVEQFEGHSPADGVHDDDPWRLREIRDGWLDITRVSRSRAGSRIAHYINDPRYYDAGSGGTRRSFAGYLDCSGPGCTWSTTLPGGASIPSVEHLYGGSFFFLHWGWDDPVFQVAAGGFGAVPNNANNPLGNFPDGGAPAPSSFATLCYTNELVDFGQALASADFVPDRPYVAGSYKVGAEWPAKPDPAKQVGYPDLLVGMGYELSGVPNRLYPFTSAQLVQRVAGFEMNGVHFGGRGGSWTAGWAEKTNKGYGVGLIDRDNDGDLDAITTQRAGALLYDNNGTPGTSGGVEGRFTQVKSASQWPCNDIPYAHTVLFREDSCTADFDNDGDQDVFLVGFAGRHDYAEGYARGERDEALDGPWLHKSSNPLHNERMLQGTQFIVNQTITPSGPGTPGAMELRSDLLDFRGRYESDQGGDRAIPADFDADGYIDMLEPRWLISAPGLPGYDPQIGDPVSTSDWSSGPGGTPDYDYIAQHRGLLFRYWHNLGDPSGATWFADEAADIDGNPSTLDPRIRCIDSNQNEHFGTLDALGGKDYAPGTNACLLHVRTYTAITAGDFNNDGFVDVAAAYSEWPSGLRNGYNLFLCDSNGVLWDSTYDAFLPVWTDANVAGNSHAGSFCLASTDYDLDGDVDIFVTFANSKDPALLVNGYNGAASNLPAHPTTPGLPRAKFTTTTFGTASPTGWVDGWLHGPQHRMNFPWLSPGEHVPEPIFWLTPFDADHDGDLDFAAFTGGASAHLFWKNRHESSPSAPWFDDRSCDATNTAASTCTTPPPSPQSILGEMRITAHPGAVATDLEVADLNGDSVPDIYAGYSSRHDAPYFGEWPEGASPIQSNKPYISKVFPELGAKVGSKIRIYGTQLSNVRRVDLVFGPQASPTVLTINQTGMLTLAPHQRYLDVQLPASVPANKIGPCGVQLYRSGVPSPVWRNTNFTLIP